MPSAIKSFLAVAVVAVAAVTLSGCETIGGILEPARILAGRGAATAMVGECALSGEQRLANLNSVNAALLEAGSAAKALSLDCDGDGQPDILQVE
jgi:hypothetical protein